LLAIKPKIQVIITKRTRVKPGFFVKKGKEKETVHSSQLTVDRE
jgi:hypothetical protein